MLGVSLWLSGVAGVLGVGLIDRSCILVGSIFEDWFGLIGFLGCLLRTIV